MRFQKLTDNKLKIFLSNEELPNSGNFDDFISNSSRARNTFLEILDRAYDEVGFNAQDHKIKIDAVALKDGSFVFTVTKLVKIRGNKKAVKPKKIPKEKNSNYAIYKFESFDDFCNFCTYIKKSAAIDINAVSSKCELYLYSNDFYLSMTNINQDYEKIGVFYSSITEFSRFFSSKDLFASVLKEKGKLFIKHNAIKNCKTP